MANNRWLRNGLVYLLIIIGVIVIFYTLIPTFGAADELPITEVITRAQNHQISRIVVEGQKLTIYPRVSEGVTASQSVSRMSEQTDIVSLLVDNGVEIGPNAVQVDFEESGGFSRVFGGLFYFLPLIFFGGLILLIVFLYSKYRR